MENVQFIEINRVISDKDSKVNTSIQPECINVSSIDSFRGWHKGKNDNMISGEMTLLVLKDREKKKEDSIEDSNKETTSEAPKVRTMLIQESYKEFLNRMSYRAVVRKLSDNESAIGTTG